MDEQLGLPNTCRLFQYQKFRQKQHSFFAGKIRRKNQYFLELIKKGRQKSAGLVKDFKG